MVNVENSFLLSIFMVALLVLPVMALYHISRLNLRGRHRLIWVLVIIFLPFFGPILYFIMYKKYIKENIKARDPWR